MLTIANKVTVIIILIAHISSVEISNDNSDSTEQDELVLVQIVGKISTLFKHILFIFFFEFCQLYRHGDRTPIRFSPNDPYRNESFWQEGFGQLTNVMDCVLLTLFGLTLFQKCILKRRLGNGSNMIWEDFFANGISAQAYWALPVNILHK